MNGNVFLFQSVSNTFFDIFPSVFEVVVVEIEPDKQVSVVQFLDDFRGVTSESERAVHYDISLCGAYIETFYILMEEYRNMSKTFFVQIVKK